MGKSGTNSQSDSEDYPFKARRIAIDKLHSVITESRTTRSTTSWHSQYTTELDNVKQVCANTTGHLTFLTCPNFNL